MATNNAESKDLVVEQLTRQHILVPEIARGRSTFGTSSEVQFQHTSSQMIHSWI